MISLTTKEGITVGFPDVCVLIESISDDEKIKLIESLSCYDAVLGHVVNQISNLYGSTENGCSGSTRCGNSSIIGNGTILDKARYEIAKSASEVAEQVISRQAREISRLNAEIEKLNNEKRGVFK